MALIWLYFGRVGTLTVRKKGNAMKYQLRALVDQLKRLWAIPEARAYLLAVLMNNLATGWFFSTYVLFLVDRGMSLQQANLINTVFMVLSFLLDPFTGKLADKIGQRRVYVAGLWTWAGGFLVYSLGNSFWHFAMAEAVSAAGHALISEALESWLRNVTDEKVAHETMSTTGAVAPIVFIPTAILGGIMGVSWGLQWPWVAAGVSGALVAIIAQKMLGQFSEPKAEKQAERAPSVAEVTRLTLKSSRLRYTIIVAFGLGMCVMPFNMFWSVTFKDLGAKQEWLGLMWIPIAVLTAVGAAWARKQTNGSSVAKAIALIGAPMLLPFLWPSFWPVATFFSFHEIGRGAIRPILFTYSNRHIENHYRSTANSIRSAMWTLGGATGLIASGFLTKILTPVEIWAVSAVILLILATYAKVKG